MNEPPATRSELWRTRLGRFRKRLKSAAPFASGVLAALLALLLYHVFFPGSRQLTTSELNNTIALAMASATPAPAYSARVYQIIQPSLVLVQTQEVDDTGSSQHSLGSGVVVDTAGDILTSLHVVVNASDVLVTFADGTQSSARVLVRQPQNDIAVLRADQPPAQLVPAVLGNPNLMHVGDEAYVVGNPFGLYGSMSAGVISGFNRTFQPPFSNQKLEGLIQIDAAVNPGNSGGPLLNRDGEVIGIIEGIINPTQGDFFIGIGFAVPITAAGGAAGLPPY
jgi:S1-C subfamily serine protease